MVMILAFQWTVHSEPENAAHFPFAYNYVRGTMHRYFGTVLTFSVP